MVSYNSYKSTCSLPIDFCSIPVKKTRCTQGVRVVFSEQECDPITVLVCINLTLLLRKSCNVQRTLFEIVVLRNVGNWIQSLALCILAQTTHP